MRKQLSILILGTWWFLTGWHCTVYAHTEKDAQNSLTAGDYDLAMSICQKNLPKAKSKEEKISYLTVMAAVYRYKKQDALAIPYLSTAISLMDKSNTNNLSFTLQKRGDSYSSVGKLEMALADYNAASSGNIGPRGMINLLKNRVALYTKMNQYDKAIADVNLSLKLTDSLLGDKAEVSRIMRVRGDKVALLYTRSKLYDKVGKTEEAKRDRAAADKLSEEI